MQYQIPLHYTHSQYTQSSAVFTNHVITTLSILKSMALNSQNMISATKMLECA